MFLMMNNVLEATTLCQENTLGLWPGGGSRVVVGCIIFLFIIINKVMKNFYANKLNGNNVPNSRWIK
jgi:hypothetical protein